MSLKKVVYLFFTLTICHSCCTRGSYDVCVYGETAAATVAAYEAAKEGTEVILIVPEKSTEEMSPLDPEDEAIWTEDDFPTLLKQNCRLFGNNYGKIEPESFRSIASEDKLAEYEKEPGITVCRGCRLESVEKDGDRMVSITCGTPDGERTIKAGNFIDCSYDSDIIMSVPDISIPENSGYVERSKGWIDTPDSTSFGASCLALEKSSLQEFVRYNLPPDISGTYTVYAYLPSSQGLNPQISYEIASGEDYWLFPIDLSECRRGWKKLGNYTFAEGQKSTITLIVADSDLPAKADDIILMKL